MDVWEIAREYLSLGRVLGEGAFGKVVEGRLRAGWEPIGSPRHRNRSSTSSLGSSIGEDEEEVTVAVKMLLGMIIKYKSVVCNLVCIDLY